MSTLTESGPPSGCIPLVVNSAATGWVLVRREPWNDSQGRSGNWTEVARGKYPTNTSTTKRIDER